jgi:two-component system, NarL family, response regulator NreC
VIHAVQAGARGYVLKESAGQELIEAIAAVAEGEMFFSRASVTSCDGASNPRFE